LINSHIILRNITPTYLSTSLHVLHKCPKPVVLVSQLTQMSRHPGISKPFKDTHWARTWWFDDI